MTKRKESKIVDPTLKEKWVTALRSGDYIQGDGSLKVLREDGTCEHCCLGVLCELVAPEGFTSLDDAVPDHDVKHTFNGKSFQESYPNQVELLKLGITRSMMKDLAEKNDNGMSFGRIADYIEEKL